MNGGDPAGDQNPQHPRFIRMPASDSPDAQQRVMSWSAYDLQLRATAHSASSGQPGFVPDDYLEHLNDLGLQPTITADELCSVGMWDRTGGGYRILDYEAVQACQDLVRQRKDADQRALAQEREHQARAWAPMAKPVMVSPPCAACGTPSARIELVAPGTLPAQWDQWPSTVQASITRDRQPGQWHLLVTGPAAGNGYGDFIDAARAGQIAVAFQPPLRFAQVHQAGFYDDAGFCPDCDAPYCHRHWHVSETGYGSCPHGHGKNLNPHWSPLAASDEPGPR
jgi:hypothetical protein